MLNSPRSLITASFMAVLAGLSTHSAAQVPSGTGEAAFVQWCGSDDLNREQKRTLDALMEREKVSECRALYTKLSQFPGLSLSKLGKNGVKDISFAKFLPVRGIYLDNNRIEDISPLALAPNLEKIGLRNNQVSDVSALANAPVLKELNLYQNQIRSLESIKKLKPNVKVFMEGNPVDRSECTLDTNNRAVLAFCLDEKAFRAELVQRPVPQDFPQADLEGIVAAVIAEPDVSMYLHPEVPGRLPVKVALLAPWSGLKISGSAFGQAIVTADPNDLRALRLNIDRRGDYCEVKVGYKPEGIFGSVLLRKTSEGWRAMKSTIYE